jgi:DNA-directed RNA polymerase subunit RPC12/RpoP
MRALIPGQWYILFTCSNCKSKQILFPDLSNGKSRIRATYSVSCTQCGHRASYDSDTIERYQHPADADGITNNAPNEQLLEHAGREPLALNRLVASHGGVSGS